MPKFLASLCRSEAGRWTPGGAMVMGLIVAYATAQTSGTLSLEFLLTVVVFSFLSVVEFYSAGWFHGGQAIRALGAGSASGNGHPSDGGR